MVYFLFVLCPNASKEDIEGIMSQEGIIGTRMRRDKTFEVLFETGLTHKDNDMLPDGMKVYYVPESRYIDFGIKI